MLVLIAPLMLPHPIAIPRVTLRLYDPSTFPATHALDKSYIVMENQKRDISYTELAKQDQKVE